MQRHILTGYANVAAPNLSVAYQPSGDEPGCVARNGKADALGRTNHCRVHADDFARGVNERSAGVARIQCRVGLNNVVDQRPDCEYIERPSALITPAVTLAWNPKGFP